MVYEVITTLEGSEVLRRAKRFFAERVPLNAAYPEREGPAFLTLRGQGGEEIAFAVWPAPLTLDEAREMIRKIRGYRILTAFRGRPAADLEAVAQVLCDVGQLACQCQERIAELEINPLFVLPEGSGVIVGDALAVLR